MSGKLRAYEQMPGWDYLKLDRTFLLFKRKSAAGGPPVPAEYEETARDCDRYLSQLIAEPQQPREPGGL